MNHYHLGPFMFFIDTVHENYVKQNNQMSISPFHFVLSCALSLVVIFCAHISKCLDK